MSRFAILLAALALSCNRPAPSSVDPPEAAATGEPASTPITQTPTKPDTQFTPVSATNTETQPAPAAPTVFTYPPDLAGQQLPRVVAPKVPLLPKTEKFGQEPLGRATSKVLDPDPMNRTVYAPAPVSFPRPVGIKPVSPAEKIPTDLGLGVDAIPARMVFPVGVGITTRARDVNLPPDLPILGRPVPDRASLEDPTAETGNASIVSKSLTPTLLPSAFQRMGLPDPFELADQVKPRVPPAADPSVLPVPVNPARVK